MMKNNAEPRLETAYFHITYACGHKCPFCYLGQDTTRLSHHDITGEKLVAIVSKLAEAKVATVCLVGGDPACSPHVMSLARACYHQGLTTSILSNTHRYNDTTVRKLAPITTSFETTFHGSNATEHDRVCGVAGAYDAVIGRLRHAAACGSAVVAVLNVMPHTSAKLFKIAQALVKKQRLPLYAVMLQRIMPFGAARDKTVFALSSNDVQNTLAEAAKIKDELGLPVIFEDPLPINTTVPTSLNVPRQCLWGLTKASIDPYGNVSCCGANPSNPIGNLFDTPLEELWRTKNAPHLAKMRAVSRTCESCPEILG